MSSWCRWEREAPLTSPLSTAFAMLSISTYLPRGGRRQRAGRALAAVALAGEPSLPFGQARAVELEDAGLSGHEEEAVGRAKAVRPAQLQVTIMLRTASGSRFSAVVKPSDTIRDLKDCRSTRIATDSRRQMVSRRPFTLQFHLPNVHQLYLSWRETHYAGCSITDLLDGPTVAALDSVGRPVLWVDVWGGHWGTLLSTF